MSGDRRAALGPVRVNRSASEEAQWGTPTRATLLSARTTLGLSARATLGLSAGAIDWSLLLWHLEYLLLWLLPPRERPPVGPAAGELVTRTDTTQAIDPTLALPAGRAVNSLGGRTRTGRADRPETQIGPHVCVGADLGCAVSA